MSVVKIEKCINFAKKQCYTIFKKNKNKTKEEFFMKQKSQNTQSGITLVALIITIIVLLILAMVSIRLVMNGGIIDRAEKGTQAYK